VHGVPSTVAKKPWTQQDFSPANHPFSKFFVNFVVFVSSCFGLVAAPARRDAY
jgi:hypothetical protein